VNPTAPAVTAAARTLIDVYRLSLDFDVASFVIEPEEAKRILEEGSPVDSPRPAPRSGVLIREDSEGAQLGLYLDPEDLANPGAVIEETSHLLYLVWHARRDLPVSRLLLEIQGEVDRYVVSRLYGEDGFGHFRVFEWADWMDVETRRIYAMAHRTAHRYCAFLSARFPSTRDNPELLRELRRYYRATPDQKLHPA
jgi:hypothetical protein